MLDAVKDAVTGGSKRNAKFQVYKNASNEFWHWRLVAANGEELAYSEPYRSKDAAMKGIDAVKRAADSADTVELDQPPKREGSAA